MFYHTVDSILDALDRNHEAVIAGRLSGESLYAEAAKIIREQHAEIERLRAAVLFFSKHYDGPSDNMLSERDRELFQLPELLRKSGGE